MPITKEDSMRIWEAVKANHALLNGCIGPHDFSIEHERRGSFVRRWQCAKCGGTIETVNRSWYLAGLKHGLASHT